MLAGVDRVFPASFPGLGRHLWYVVRGISPALVGVRKSEAESTEESRFRGNAAHEAPNDYVGSAACARCHLAIYREFSRTRMGRSLTPVTPELLHRLPPPGSYDNRELDRRFETFARDGKLYQSEYQTGADGKEIFRDTQQVQWVIGAGANGFGGLVERGEYLFEAPLSYYERLQGWRPSPGYESRDLAFTTHRRRVHLVPQRPSAARRLSYRQVRKQAFSADCDRLRKLPWSRRSAYQGRERA